MNNASMSKTAKTKRRSLGITLGVHAGLIALALIPMTKEMQQTTDVQEYVTVPVIFTSAEVSERSSGKTVEVPTKVETVEETAPVENVMPVVEQEVTEEQQPEEEVMTTEESEVIASETTNEPSEAVVETGGESAAAEEGGSGEADGPGSGDGKEYVGVITRKVIYRAPIAEAAANSGTIVVDVCINRMGKILEVAFNPEGTTISDMDMVRHALDIASQYRFAADYDAAYIECGTMTFIFDVKDGRESAELIATAN